MTFESSRCTNRLFRQSTYSLFILLKDEILRSESNNINTTGFDWGISETHVHLNPECVRTSQKKPLDEEEFFLLPVPCPQGEEKRKSFGIQLQRVTDILLYSRKLPCISPLETRQAVCVISIPVVPEWSGDVVMIRALYVEISRELFSPQFSQSVIVVSLLNSSIDFLSCYVFNNFRISFNERPNNIVSIHSKKFLRAIRTFPFGVNHR